MSAEPTTVLIDDFRLRIKWRDGHKTTEELRTRTLDEAIRRARALIDSGAYDVLIACLSGCPLCLVDVEKAITIP